MNITQIHTKLEELVKMVDRQTFVYDFLQAYGLPKSTISRLQKGNLNMSNVEGEVDLKKKLHFKAVADGDVSELFTQLAKDIKHKERFVIVTDFELLLAIDTKTGEKLDIDLVELPKHFDFFLPLAGMEKAQHHDENPADIKAAEKMAKLFDIIKKDNPDDSPEFVHGLNVFLSRLLFCFFAEDTHIFEENQFTNAIDSHTQTDGSDLNTFLDTLFLVLNTPKDKRRILYRSLSGVEGEVPQYLNDFPYVNGGLFEKAIPSPIFTRRSRIAVIDNGGQGWEAINPDIFGSMFQAVISADQRGSLGQHYTSVPNMYEGDRATIPE